MITIGIDEAGYGPVAGPLVTSAVVLHDATFLLGVKDSKAFTGNFDDKLRRLWEVGERVRAESLYWVVSAIDAETINDRGMGWCLNQNAHIVAAAARARYPDARVIVDGDKIIPGISNQRALPKADKFIHTVSAASILAKGYQLQSMSYWHEIFQDWGFGAHAGYPTLRHKHAIWEHGLCPIHRKTSAEKFASGAPSRRKLSAWAAGTRPLT